MAEGHCDTGTTLVVVSSTSDLHLLLENESAISRHAYMILSWLNSRNMTTMFAKHNLHMSILGDNKYSSPVLAVDVAVSGSDSSPNGYCKYH